MSGTQQTGFDSQEEEYYIISSDNEEGPETEETVSDPGEVDSGEETGVNHQQNNETQEYHRARALALKAIISSAIQCLCYESIKTGKPLNSSRHAFIAILEKFDISFKKFDNEELEVYIDAMIQKNNEYGDCISQLKKIGAEKAVVNTMTSMKQNVLKKLKEAEDEMMKRKV